MKKQKNKGFTLLDALVVTFIIGLLSTFIVVKIDNSKRHARDTVRMANLNQIKDALLLFYDDNGRFPDFTNDGVSESGEVMGDENGVIESLLGNYMPKMFGDPSFDDLTGENDYFYAYDPTHLGCQPVISINRFETSSAQTDYGRQDTVLEDDMHMDTAHYNECLTFE